MKRPRSWTLQASFAGLLVATFVPLAVLSGFGLFWQAREERARLAREAQETAELIASEAGLSVAGVQERLAVLAGLPEVHAANPQKVEKLFRGLLASAPHLENLGLVTPDGTVIASAVTPTAGRPVSLRDRQWLQRVFRWGAPAIGGFQVGRITGKPTVILAHPVLGHGEQMQSVVFAALNLAHASRSITWAYPNVSMLWAVVDEQGLVLLDSRSGSAAGKPLDLPPGMLRGETVVPGTSWRCVVGMPVDMATARVRKDLLRIGLPAMLILFAAAGVGLWIAYSTWQPLRDLTTAVRRIGTGDSTVRIPVEAGGEVGELAATFAKTLATLERRRGELAALLEATQVMASSLDLDQSLRVIIEQATIISGISVVRLFLRDEEGRMLRYRVGVGIPVEEERGIEIPVGESFSGQVAATGKPLAVPDTRGDPRLRYPQHTTKHGLISYLGLPVRIGDQILGVLVFNTTTPRIYSADEIAYLSAFANEAAIAIENARLHTAALHQGNQLAALLHATRSVMAGLDLRETLHRIIAEAAQICGCMHVKVLLVDKTAGTLRVGAIQGTAAMLPEDHLPLGKGLSGIVAATGQPLFIEDCPNEPRNPYAERDRELGIVTHLGLPIKVGGEVVGVLTFTTTAPRIYSQDEIAYLSAFADQAALAIENARLYDSIRHHAHDLEARVRERTAELEEALGAKTELLRRMSHELRTPLNFVLGFSQLLQRQTAGPLTPKQATYVDRIHSGGKRLQDLVTSVLDISQVERGESRLRLESVPLAPLVQEALGGFHAQATQKLLTVTAALDPELPCVVVDRPKLIRILTNLMANAVKFTPDGGRVTVTARRITWPSGDLGRGQLTVSPDRQIPQLPDGQPAGEGVELAVEDTGIGLRVEDLEMVFEPFYQVDGSETRAFEGAGLGLSQVRKFVELHHGRVLAESAGLGHGSRFVVRLPHLKLPQAPRILLVEDETTVREALAMALEIAGYGVVQAPTGGEALLILAQAAPDLLVLDCGLPDMNGWAVLTEVRRMEGTRALPVLVLTGLEHVHAKEALAFGANEFLTKPVSSRVLIETVARLLVQPSTQTTAPGPGIAGVDGDPSK